MAILDEIGASIRQLAEGAGPSVVGIGQRWGVGSGIVLGEGTGLTNGAQRARRSEQRSPSPTGGPPRGNVTGRDIDGDLAVISVDTSAGVPAPAVVRSRRGGGGRDAGARPVQPGRGAGSG